MMCKRSKTSRCVIVSKINAPIWLRRILIRLDENSTVFGEGTANFKKTWQNLTMGTRRLFWLPLTTKALRKRRISRYHIRYLKLTYNKLASTFIEITYQYLNSYPHQYWHLAMIKTIMKNKYQYHRKTWRYTLSWKWRRVKAIIHLKRDEAFKWCNQWNDNVMRSEIAARTKHVLCSERKAWPYRSNLH